MWTRHKSKKTDQKGGVWKISASYCQAISQCPLAHFWEGTSPSNARSKGLLKLLDSKWCFHVVCGGCVSLKISCNFTANRLPENMAIRLQPPEIRTTSEAPCILASEHTNALLHCHCEVFLKMWSLLVMFLSWKAWLEARARAQREEFPRRTEQALNEYKA